MAQNTGVWARCSDAPDCVTSERGYSCMRVMMKSRCTTPEAGHTHPERRGNLLEHLRANP